MFPYRSVAKMSERAGVLGHSQPRPQGLPRGGARAEEDPGKIRWNLQDSWRFIACAVTTTLCCWLQLALALTIFLLENIHVLLIVYVFILKVLTIFTRNTSDISCKHTCTKNYATFIIILYQFVGVWRSYLWHWFVRFGNPRIYQMLFGFKCDWIKTDSVASNMKWYWLIVLYIKVRTVHLYWIYSIYFHTLLSHFLRVSEITFCIKHSCFTHTERLHFTWHTERLLQKSQFLTYRKTSYYLIS